MKVSKEALRISRQLFAATVKDGKIEKATAKKIVTKLAETKPRNYLQIIHAYTRWIELELQKRHAVVESAQSLDKSTKDEVLADLQKKYGDDITSEFNVNAELLGGMRIKVGSDVFDGSVKSRLGALRDKLLN